MKVVRTASGLRRALAPAVRDPAVRVGLVPTMGALHEGHVALLRQARSDCEVVVMSLFVNPAQFGAGEDLDSYPRAEEPDVAIADAEGVDLVFAPPDDEIYPPGFATRVEVRGLSEVLCGNPSRRSPEHFAGVATVVTKLLNLAQPDIAYFGQKDAQQAIVIRRLVRDLDIPVEIRVCETVRAPDGLALSSRNAYLTPAERTKALALSRAMSAAELAVARGARARHTVLDAARAELKAAGVDPEYLELRSASDLAPVERVNGSTLLAVAATIGRARLIDNTILGDP